MRKKFVAGNWKMHGSRSMATALVNDIVAAKPDSIDVAVFPPFPYLGELASQHAGSGLGFGLTLNFKRATDALTLAASFPVDWTQDAETLKLNPEFRKAGYTVQAEYSKGFDKDAAIRRLAELEPAA